MLRKTTLYTWDLTLALKDVCTKDEINVPIIALSAFRDKSKMLIIMNCKEFDSNVLIIMNCKEFDSNEHSKYSPKSCVREFGVEGSTRGRVSSRFLRPELLGR